VCISPSVPTTLRSRRSFLVLVSTCTASFTSETMQTVRSPTLLHALTSSFIFGTEIVAPIEREIRLLSHGLTSVKDEQEYIVVRERTHRNTAESTNSRVKWWSIMQAVVLFSVVAWQVYYLKVTFLSCSSVGTWLTRLSSLSLRSRELFRVVVEFCYFFACCTHVIAPRKVSSVSRSKYYLSWSNITMVHTKRDETSS
jgi:hypothetical protein